MISKERFSKIEVGDVILIGKRYRNVIGTSLNGRKQKVKYIMLSKISGFGKTSYLYNDLKHKIKVIFTLKSK